MNKLFIRRASVPSTYLRIRKNNEKIIYTDHRGIIIGVPSAATEPDLLLITL